MPPKRGGKHSNREHGAVRQPIRSAYQFLKQQDQFAVGNILGNTADDCPMRCHCSCHTLKLSITSILHPLTFHFRSARPVSNVAQAPGEREWEKQLEWTATLLHDIEAEMEEGPVPGAGVTEVPLLNKVALVRKRLLKLQNDLALLWQTNLKRTQGVSPAEQQLRFLLKRFANLRASPQYKDTLRAAASASGRRQAGESGHQHYSNSIGGAGRSVRQSNMTQNRQQAAPTLANPQGRGGLYQGGCTLALLSHAALSRCTLTLHSHAALSRCTLTLLPHAALSRCTLLCAHSLIRALSLTHPLTRTHSHSLTPALAYTKKDPPPSYAFSYPLSYYSPPPLPPSLSSLPLLTRSLR
jgi:hypothetical protein